jgi:ribosome assembly protein 1
VADCTSPSYFCIRTLTYHLPSLRDAAVEETQQTVGETIQARDFSNRISYAFQLAMQQGPLCNEPVQGVAVFLEEVLVNLSTDDESSARDRVGRLTGEVIKTTQQAIRQGFMDWSPRLLLAIYSCEIQASSKSRDPKLPANSFSPSF